MRMCHRYRARHPRVHPSISRVQFHTMRPRLPTDHEASRPRLRGLRPMGRLEVRVPVYCLDLLSYVLGMDGILDILAYPTVRVGISHSCRGRICARFATLVSVLVDVCSIRDLHYSLVNALS